jgi:hypothetical protein
MCHTGITIPEEHTASIFLEELQETTKTSVWINGAPSTFE